jgi:hypothetical protein
MHIHRSDRARTALAVTQLALFPLPPQPLAPLRHRFEYMNGGPCVYSNHLCCAGCGQMWWQDMTKAAILAAGIFDECPGQWP